MTGRERFGRRFVAHVVSGERKSVAIAAAALSAVLVFATVLVSSSGYMEKDDVIMADMARGAGSGKPSHRLVFIGVLAGWPLRLLYSVSPTFGWYSILMLSLNAVATSVLLFVVWTRRSRLGSPATAASVAFAVGAAVIFCIRVSFTPTAFMLGCAGILLTFAVDAASPHRRAEWCVAGMLLGASWVIRSSAFVGVVILFTPFLAWWILKVRKQAAWFFAAALVVVGGSWGADHLSYLEYNEVRGSLHETVGSKYLTIDRDRPEVVTALTSSDWTSAQFNLFNHWFLYNREEASPDRLRALRSVIRSRGVAPALGVTFGEISAVAAWCAVALLAGVRRDHRRDRAITTLQYVWILAVCARVASTQRFPTRVALPIALASSLVLLIGPAVLGGLATTSRASPVRLNRISLFLWAVPCAVVAALATMSVQTHQQMGLARQAFETSVDRLSRLDADGLFINVGTALHFEGEPATRHRTSRARLLLLTWNTFSPADSVQRRAYGVGEPLLQSLVDRPSVYLVMHDFLVEDVSAAILAETGESAELVETEEIRPDVHVYRLVFAVQPQS
jgi:hypothetical protein